MLVICWYSVGQKNFYGNLLNRSNHNKVLVQKLLFYLAAFEFLAKVSNIYAAFSCNDIESRFFNTWNLHNIITWKLFRKDPHPHAGVLSAGQYDLPQYLQIANFYMHFYLHFAIFYKLIHLQIFIKGNKWRKIWKK